MWERLKDESDARLFQGPVARIMLTLMYRSSACDANRWPGLCAIQPAGAAG